MKTKIDHLLACIGEECGEIQQVVGKATRFGLYDKNPANDEMNFNLLKKELQDLIAVYEMLCAEEKRDGLLNQLAISDKKKRVLYYMEYAREVGELEKV
jgi:NTP pyrophosphatase (non-canonical NTP hydrolase)